MQAPKAMIWEWRGNSLHDLQIFERESLISTLDYFCLISRSAQQLDQSLDCSSWEEGRQVQTCLLKICCQDMKVLILCAGHLSTASTGLLKSQHESSSVVHVYVLTQVDICTSHFCSPKKLLHAQVMSHQGEKLLSSNDLSWFKMRKSFCIMRT